MADSKGTFETLQSLIQTCRNGETGYMHAAAKTKDPELKSFFDQQSRERSRFAVELTDAAGKLGKVEPRRKGTVAGVLHRAWFEMKADFGGGDQGILRSVQMGEARAKSAYEQALASSLSPDVLALVSRQHENVKAAHDRVRSWGSKPIARSA
jgi:uncharacterized protein (TIGR02284 family)